MAVEARIRQDGPHFSLKIYGRGQSGNNGEQGEIPKKIQIILNNSSLYEGRSAAVHHECRGGFEEASERGIGFGRQLRFDKRTVH